MNALNHVARGAPCVCGHFIADHMPKWNEPKPGYWGCHECPCDDHEDIPTQLFPTGETA